MPAKHLSILAVIPMMALACWAGDKTQWQTGTLVDAVDVPHCRTVGLANAAGAAIGQVCTVTTHYKIETADAVYVFSRTMNNRRDKPLIVTVHGPVQFALGDNSQLRDDAGKSHSVVFERKTLKESASPAK